MFTLIALVEVLNQGLQWADTVLGKGGGTFLPTMRVTSENSW
jgi:hypothetical protein